MECLKEEVRRMLMDACDQPLADNWCHCVEMIDDLQRLGISYHFQHTIIDDFLRRLHQKVFSSTAASDHQLLAGAQLHHVALGFRLLRQQGHNVSTSVFDGFMDGEGSFKDELSTDTKGLLSLYEASYLSIEGEDVLDAAKVFTETHLRASIPKLPPNSELARSVEHALEHTVLHWGVPRSEARHYMDSLDQLQLGGHLHPNRLVMLEFAKLDFNRVQSLYKTELEELRKWWDRLGLADVIKIARNDISLYYSWSLLIDGPEESSQRVLLAKVIAMTFVLDDIYDVWGSAEDMNMATEALRRWDLLFMDELPTYLKIPFMAFYNIINEIGYYVLKKHNVNAVQHLWKEIVIFYEECLKEAEKERMNSKHVVNAEEYLNNRIIAIGVHLVMCMCFFLLGETMNPENTDYMDRYGFMWHAATIIRISNDLDATKNGREGDSSYLEYYMLEHGVGMEAAEEEAARRMADEWKKFNSKCLNPKNPFSRKFISATRNFCRAAHVIQDVARGRHKKILKDMVLESV